MVSVRDRRLDSIITHRRDVAWLDADKTFQENVDVIHATRHTWYPVCAGDIDSVKGILCAKDLWATQSPISILEHIKPAFFLPGSTMVLQAIEQFKSTQNHVALIVDEHGSFEGLVTHHDLSSVILGTLPSRGELEEEDPIVQRQDGSWLVNGSLSVHDFSEHFDCSLTDDSAEHDFQTVAGFVITHLEKIPREADYFEWKEFRFEVVDMDGNRVDKILVNRILV
jgi:putative hemolysin